jgi:hypothetical protein
MFGESQPRKASQKKRGGEEKRNRTEGIEETECNANSSEKGRKKKRFAESHTNLVRGGAGNLRIEEESDGGGGGANVSGMNFDIFQPGKHHESLVGAVVGVAPSARGAKIEETRQKPVGAYVFAFKGFQHAGAMKFGDAGEFIARQSAEKS